jgi:hypothetical protein
MPPSLPLVPGLASTPVIDIAAAVHSGLDADACVDWDTARSSVEKGPFIRDVLNGLPASKG